MEEQAEVGEDEGEALGDQATEREFPCRHVV